MSSLKITCHLPDGELVNSNEISAKMISFIRKGQLRLPADVDAALADCRACFISALLDPSVVEALDSPTAIFVAADGSKSLPIAVEALNRACIVHALPDGNTLPASMGGPLCVRFSAGAPVKRSVNGVIGLEVRGGGATPTAGAAPPPAPTSDWLAMRLDGADVRRQLAAMAASSSSPRHRHRRRPPLQRKRCGCRGRVGAAQGGGAGGAHGGAEAAASRDKTAQRARQGV